MKKIIVGLATVLVGASMQFVSATYLPGAQGSGIAVGTEWFFNQQDLPAAKSQSQCTEFWGQETYYLSGDADADGIPDLGKQWYFKDNFVYNSTSQTRGAALILPRFSTYSGTTVSYYTPSSNMLNIYNGGVQYPLSSNKAWYRYSKVAPLNQPVRAVTSEPFLIEAPASRLASDANFQIAFDINFAVFSSWGTSTSDYFVATVASLTDLDPIPASSKWYMKSGLTDPSGPLRSSDFSNQTTLISARSINWSNEIAHGTECVNVNVKWCGDGIKDTAYGEACDLGSQNGQPGSQCTNTCQTVPVVQDPDVTILKTVVGATTGYLSNDIVTYKLTYRNIGTGLANNVIIKDILPAGVTYISSTGTPNIGTPTLVSNVLTWPTIATLAPGAQGEIIVQVRVTQFSACTAYTNGAGIAASNEPTILNGNNSSSADFTTKCPDPDVVTQKSVSAISGSYLPGNTVEYTLTYQNIGAAVANGVIVTDTLPSQVTYVANSSTSTPNIGQPTVNGQVLTWNVGSLNPGQSGEIKIRVTIKASTPTCTNLIVRNDFTISATNEPSSLLGNNPSNVTFPMQCLDLFSNKTVDKAVVVSGDIVTYTITYGNNGNVAWPGTVTDTLPAGMQYVLNSSNSTPNVGQPTVNGQVLTWNVGLLPGGSSRTITIQAKVLGATLGQTFLNTVCIADDNNYNNNNCGNATSVGTGSTGQNIIDLWSNKVVDKPTVVSGDIVTYTITYGNSGNVTAPGTVTDTLPAGMQYVANSTTSNPNVGQPVVNGQNLVWNVGNLPAGSVRTITFKAKVIQATSNQQYVNLVCIADDNNYNNNNCGTATSVTTGGGGNNIDLWSNKVVDKPTVVLGDIVTYTITYGNSGSVAAPGVVTDTLPAGVTYEINSATSNPNVGQPVVNGQTLTRDVGILPAGSVRTITFKAKIATLVSNGQYVNLVCIADDNNFNNNNCGTATSCITTGTNNIDLWSRKVVDKPNVVLNDVVTYTITYGNSGNVAATGVVTDTIPAGMQYVVGSSTSNPNVGQPVVNGQVLTWDVGLLPAGSVRTITIQAIVAVATPGQVYLNTVCIADDNNYNNNNCGSATSTTTGGGGSTKFDLSIDKTPKVQVAYSGQDVTFTLTVKNAGPAAANGFSVNDYLPAGLQFVSANPGATYNATSRTITWNGLSLNANGSLSLTVVAKYTSSSTEVNWAEICAYNGVNSGLTPRDIDSDPCNGTGNNEDDVSSGKVINAYIDLNIDKLANGVKTADVFSGEIVDFSLVVGNSGTVAASNFSVNDYLPAGFVFVQASFGGVYDNATRKLTWTGLDLAPGASTILTFKATYVDSVDRTNFAEVCTYNGLNGTGIGPKDIDSDPCNRGANPGIEDDESAATVRPRSVLNAFDLSIDKLIDGVKIKSGASSGQQYTITLNVTNSGGVGVSNFSVNDYMPVGLEYVSGTSNLATTTYDPTTRIITFSSLNIGAHQTIPLTFKAIFAAPAYVTNYTEICNYRGTNASGNDARDIDSNPCNRGPNLPIEDDESSAQIGPGGGGGGGPTMDLTLNKLVNGVKDYQANNNETVTFTLHATNEGNTTIVNGSVVDYLPLNVEYVSGSANTIAPATVSYDAATRKLVWSGLTFTNNNGFDLTFRAVYTASDVRTNYAEICTYNGKTTNTSGLPTSSTNPQDPDSDPCNRGATTPVEDDESSAIIRPRSGGCSGNCGGGSRNYCGDGLIARPNSYGYYEECDEGANNGKPGYNCSLTCKRGGGWGGDLCGDGVLQYGEICDQGKNGGKIPVGRPYAGRMCTSSCTLPGVSAPACDYIDPPSIMSNEYLPYRWDLEDVDGLNDTCSNAGDVIRSSMMCTFSVTDAKGSKVANANGQFEWTAPCHDPVADRLTRTAYVQVIKSLGYDPDSSAIRPYGFNSSKFNFTFLGEHKISMKLQSYKMCVANTSGSGYSLQDITFDQMATKRVCEMNFAVTTPYMVSRGPLGNFSTDSLTSFLYMPDGLQVFTSPVPKITQKFNVTSEVTASVKKLVDEYKKVAVVADALPEFGNVSKVPGKDIYFFEGNRDDAYVTISDTNASALGNKPFTIILTRGHLVIKGNLAKAKNGMYINAGANGSIRFAMDDKAGVNGVKGCDVTQEVNGIFISVNTVESYNHLGELAGVANTDINKDWCNGGDLTIRGVLIGNGIDSVVSKRRSNVNTWFTELTNINADRKEYLLNHGAVVLKYNPELFDNLPPGAEILAQVLNTYKK